MDHRQYFLPVLLLLGTASPAFAQTAAAPVHQRIDVQLDAAAGPSARGRLLIFATEATAAEAAALAESKGKSSAVPEVDANPFNATQTAVAARETGLFKAGQTVSMDADAIAFPAPYSQLPPGDYYVQAVLDRDHNYNYAGRHAGDMVSEVQKVHLPSAQAPLLKLVRTVPARDPWALPESASAEVREMAKATRSHAQPVELNSKLLGAFWGRPVAMRAWVLTPPGYQGGMAARYPTVYMTGGFGSSFDNLVGPLSFTYAAMAKGEMPPMIWVFLDHASATGTHEFADSVNNGPWGEALTSEMIPKLEQGYRMDGRAGGRFLTGHSSGGWATLWLQTRYPKVFGGTWSTSPDPADFHDFTGIDLYAAGANLYRKADGSAYPLVRDHGKVLGTAEQFARLETVLGEYGGQLASFEWVFSPRGADGRPQQLFDRDTGAIDAAVAAYWREHFDIAERLQKNWPGLRKDLDGKIHVVVGTADTFYLDGAAHRLQAVLDGLHAKSSFEYLQDKTHFDLYAKGDDRRALLKQISWDMYALARPKAAKKAPAAK
jgi:enterochelin esterase-like enzyme